MKVVADPGVAALVTEFTVVIGVAGSCDMLQQLLVLLSKEYGGNVQIFYECLPKLYVKIV